LMEAHSVLNGKYSCLIRASRRVWQR
jgi:hypothetical protein